MAKQCGRERDLRIRDGCHGETPSVTIVSADVRGVGFDGYSGVGWLMVRRPSG